MKKDLLRNNSIDLFRLVCAILVVAIHTAPFFDINEYLCFFFYQILPRIAVPFFFTVAGFYYIGALNSSKKVFWGYCKKILIGYSIWSTIYVLIQFFTAFGEEFQLVPFLKSVVFNYFISGSYYHLWYFPALLFAVIVVTVFYKLKINILLFPLSHVFFLIGCAGCAYFNLGMQIPFLSNIISSGQFQLLRRVLGMGFAFFVLGGILNKFQNQLLSISNKRIFCLLAITVILFLTEIFCCWSWKLYQNIVLTVFLYPLVGLIMLVLLKNPLPSLKRQGGVARRCANVIYYIHPAIILLISGLWKDCPNTIQFFLVTVISMGLGLILPKNKVFDKYFI